MKEIGSEFALEKTQYCNKKKLQNNIGDYIYTFSGRTAIETVLKNEPRVKTALLPSYCCDSMIAPFRKSGIKIKFYDVNYDNGLHVDFQIPEKTDLVLWCNYFGFKKSMPDLTKFISKGGIVVEDVTHSFFSKEPFNGQSQYIVASIRKWGPVLCGGYCASIKKKMKYKPNLYPQSDFLKRKKDAMRLKAMFLENKMETSKETFLQEYSLCNEWIENNYSGLMIDQESIEIFKNIDWSECREKRINNAKILYSGLKNNDFLQFIFNEDEMECPLFVPVIIKNMKRDYIRAKLIANKIYCPIHWPKSKEGCSSNLYDLELSLVCDQRYNKSDMERIVTVINTFLK